MKILISTICFFRSHVQLLGLLILLDLPKLFFDSFEFHSRIVVLFLNIISLGWSLFALFITAGIYAIVWKNFTGYKIQISDLSTESKKHFSNFLFASIMVGFLYLFLWITIQNFIRLSFFPNMTKEIYQLSNHGIFVSNITASVLSLLLSFAFPLIYLNNFSAYRAVASSIYYLGEYLIESYPIIVMIIVNFVYNISVAQLTAKIGKNTGIELMNNIVGSMFEAIIFLVSCQVLYGVLKNISPRQKAT